MLCSSFGPLLLLALVASMGCGGVADVELLATNDEPNRECLAEARRKASPEEALQAYATCRCLDACDQNIDSPDLALSCYAECRASSGD